jgi:SnoaL-like protein
LAVTPREPITEYLAAARREGWDRAYGFFAADIVMHVPGRSVFADDRHGKDAAVAYIQSVRDHYRNGKVELELIDRLISGERVALLLRERFPGDRPPVEIRRANVYASKTTRSSRSRSSKPTSTPSTSS